MSFWDLSDGGTATDTGTEYEIPSGNIEPIPDGSSVLAMIDEAGWHSENEAEHIKLRWTILGPDEYKNRKVFQKLFVTDPDPRSRSEDAAAKKRDKALRMLQAINGNAGGKLGSGRPNDNDLTACLCNKPMIIKVMLWEMPDRDDPSRTISGNWIAAVSPKTKGVDVKMAKPRSAPNPASPPPAEDISDDIPF